LSGAAVVKRYEARRDATPTEVTCIAPAAQVLAARSRGLLVTNEIEDRAQGQGQGKDYKAKANDNNITVG